MRICKGCGAPITSLDLRVKTACSPACRLKVAHERQANWKHENRERYLTVRRRWIQNNQASVQASERRHVEKKRKEKSCPTETSENSNGPNTSTSA